ARRTDPVDEQCSDGSRVHDHTAGRMIHWLLINFFDHLRRHAAHDRVRRNIMSYHGSRRHDRVIPDRHTRKNGHMRTDPDSVAHMNRREMIIAPVLRLFSVIDGGKHDLGTDQYGIPDVDAALTLKVAAAV